MFHGHLGLRCTAAYISAPFREIGADYTLMNAQNSVFSFATVGQFSSISPIHRGEVHGEWHGFDVGSL
jgi:hypothetical protein